MATFLRAGRAPAWLGVLICLIQLAGPRSAAAQADEPGVEIHAFVSQGAIKTTRNNWLADSERGSFEFSEAGINFTKQLGPKLRVGLQLFAQDLGPIGNYQPQLDWYYLDYRFEDWLGVRAGRNKLPLGLYNEMNDIDSARVPILLPQTVYPATNRNYFLAQTGAELYGFVPLGVVGALDYRLYGGTIYMDLQSLTPIGTQKLTIPYLFGGRLMWQTPLSGLQAGASAQHAKLEADYGLSRDVIATLPMPLPEGFDGTVELRAPVTIWVASLEFHADALSLAAEYGQQITRTESSVPEISPNDENTSEGFYAMASYQVTPWFAPGVYYAGGFRDIDNRRGHQAYHHDLALSFRYDLTQSWIFKLESHYISGTALLTPDLNDGRPRRELARTWGAFLAKTTAYF